MRRIKNCKLHPLTQRMFIIMDVVFHEDSMYFTEPELQGEYLKGILSLVYDFEEDTVEVSEVPSQNGGDFNGQNQDFSGNALHNNQIKQDDLDLSGQNLDLNGNENPGSQDTSKFELEFLSIDTLN